MQADINEWSLFGELVELSAGEREARLGEVQVREPELAERVRRLLESHDLPVMQDRLTIEEEEAHPLTIGSYDVIELLGRGGMGNVYLCRQQQPVQRTVAVKVLKAGMDTRDVLARFDAERQALALMNHSNIAPILDAGTTADRRPFFVMEYVPGKPLVRYCRERKLSLNARLQLFLSICGAVQHAHQKGVIHRDLKPSNIVVSEIDGEPHPKIIDFGIAKATGAQLTSKTLHTLHGNLIGTPEYMSPEQADIGAIDIDTRTDVYSLGVVLYELITGTVPFSFDRSLLSLPAIQRSLRTEPLVLPSRKLMQVVERESHAQECGFRNASALRHALAGDLDWIARKALEKDRTWRYASAAELAADIVRALSFQPVTAARNNSYYLARKFMGRHRRALAGAIILTLSLVGFSTYANLQANALAVERDRANYESAKARQATAFLVNLFASVDPQAGFGREMTIREAVDIGARRIASELQHQPDLRNTLLFSIGRVYNSLGLYEPAEKTLRSVIMAPGDDGELIRKARVELGRVLSETDAFTLAEIELLSVINSGPTQAFDATTMQARLALGMVYQRWSRNEEAERQYREVAQATDPENPEQAGMHGKALVGLGDFLLATSRFNEALAPLEQGNQLVLQAYGNPSFEALSAQSSLANYYVLVGEYQKAKPYLENDVKMALQIFGQVHPATGVAYNDLSVVRVYLKDLAGAEEALKKALEINRAVYGPENRRVIVVMANLAAVYDRTNRIDEALPLYEEVLRLRIAANGLHSDDAALTQQNLGFALVRAGRFAAAIPPLRQAVKTLANLDGRQHWLYGNALRGLGSALLGTGNHVEAEPALCEAYAVLTAAIGADHERTLVAQRELKALYGTWNADGPPHLSCLAKGAASP